MSPPRRRHTCEASSRRPGIAVTLALAFLAAFSPVAADSKCGTGNAPSYTDITAVMLKRGQGYWTAYKGYRAKTFDSSAFWAVLWNWAPEIPNTYSQYDLDYQVGTYKLQATLEQAIAVLRRDRFFGISAPEVIVTDTAQEVLSVRRCRVITRVLMYDWGDEDPATVKLFADLRGLITKSRKVKVSSRPRDFAEVLLFDP